MSEKIRSVIVSLTDTMHKMSKNGSRKDLFVSNNVRILDKSTLLLRTTGGNDTSKSQRPPAGYYQQLQFDAVGFEEERHVREELNGFLEQMIRHHQSGCLLRLTPRRTHNVKLLTHLLVSDLDKLLKKLTTRLEGINVEYYDVRKFDMVNMIANSRRSKNQKEPPSSRREMHATRELFQWLHNEYLTLRARATGDDYINLEFLLNDGCVKHKVHLSLYNIFDCNARKDIIKFFKELPAKKASQNSLLFDCIRESFDPKHGISTLVLCEMPLDIDCSCKEMYHFLQLAGLASRNIGGRDMESKPIDSESSLESSKSESKEHSSQSFQARSISFSHEDYSKLSTWYHRIDSKYAEVKSAMANHYNLQYRQKFIKLCKQLRSSRNLHDKSAGDAQRLLLHSNSKDLAATANYAESLRQFRQLEKDVQKSEFAHTLSTYLSTKSYELLNAEEDLQQKEIANLRDHRSRI